MNEDYATDNLQAFANDQARINEVRQFWAGASDTEKIALNVVLEQLRDAHGLKLPILDDYFTWLMLKQVDTGGIRITNISNTDLQTFAADQAKINEVNSFLNSQGLNTANMSDCTPLAIAILASEGVSVSDCSMLVKYATWQYMKLPVVVPAHLLPQSTTQPTPTPIPTVTPTPTPIQTPIPIPATPRPSQPPAEVTVKTKWREQNAACVGGTGQFSDVATIRGFECITANVLNVVLTIFALVAFLMFVYGALMYMLSGGQPQKMEKARSTLGYAVIGLVLAISAVAILNVISYFTGVDSILTINWDAFGG